MKLEWNIEEIRLRIKEITNILKTKKLDNEYIYLYSEFIDLNAMLYFINGTNVKIDDFLTKKQRMFIDNYRKKEAYDYIKTFQTNKDMHKKLALTIIDIFQKSHFHSYEGLFGDIKNKDNVGIVREFLERFDTDQYDYFNELISRKCIQLTNKRCYIYEGITYLSHDKPYIFCKDTSDLNLGVTLIHEFDHAYSSFQRDFVPSNKSELLNEINPYFMEYRFLEFLIDNGLYVDDALLIQNRNYKQIYDYALSLIILTSINNLEYDEYYQVKNNTNEIKETILKDKNLPNSLLQMDLDGLNIYNILSYFYGNLLGLLYSSKYITDAVKTKEEMQVIMKEEGILCAIDSLNDVNKQLILNNKNMR